MDLEELVEELSLGSARGGKRRAAAEVLITPVRSLTAEDIPLLANPPVIGSLPSIPQMRNQHHQLAGLLAKGISNAEISLITGFSPSYISTLKSSPDMKELVDYYAKQAEERTVDALARLKNLGVASVEELQNRLNEDPSKFTAGQLMDLAEMGLIKPLAAAGLAAAARGTGGALQINLNFTAPKVAELASGPGDIIELEAK